jgi:hypothetical protein
MKDVWELNFNGYIKDALLMANLQNTACTSDLIKKKEDNFRRIK